MQSGNKLGNVLAGFLIVIVGALWAAAAIIGPLALIKFCWGFLLHG